jgi:hypothetical protein
MVVAAAEGTTQVPPVGILRIGEKPNPAVSAANHAPTNLGMGRQGRVQRKEILLDNGPSTIVLVPVLAKRENLLDRDC